MVNQPKQDGKTGGRIMTLRKGAGVYRENLLKINYRIHRYFWAVWDGAKKEQRRCYYTGDYRDSCIPSLRPLDTGL